MEVECSAVPILSRLFTCIFSSNNRTTNIVYKFTCRCEAFYVDRTSVHFGTRERKYVPPGIHNGSFRHLKPPDETLFEILHRFCTDEVIQKKEDGKDF